MQQQKAEGDKRIPYRETPPGAIGGTVRLTGKTGPTGKGQREWSSEGKPEKLLSISISQLLFWVVWESPTALGSEGGAGFTEAVGPSDPMLQPIGFTDGEAEV